ncbi:MAG: DUF4440 domain-containing protein [Gemmatimonadaceae bacterium]|nr:DUF4440 domain-containing protein [Gemmatimonadaceae bacterium]
MRPVLGVLGVMVLAAGCAHSRPRDAHLPAREALAATSVAIRAAFARGDVDGIMAYHHPDVVKALSAGPLLEGSTAVRANLVATLGEFRLEFVENRTESLVITGETATELAVFTIRGTPKAGGTSFVSRGRAMVVYVRSTASPSGWASIRELIQPGAP